MSLPLSRREQRWRLWADKAGMTVSALCVIHCAILPLVLALLPLASVWVLGLESYHGWVVLSLAILAIATTWLGWLRHRKFYAWAFLALGLGFLGGAALSQGTTEHVLMAIGGTLIASAHLVNLRLAHGHVHDACCRYDSGR